MLEWYLKPKATPKRVILGGEKAPVLVPFWVLATNPAAGAEPRTGGTAAVFPPVSLAYKVGEVNVPGPTAVVKGTKLNAVAPVTYRTLYATNPTRLTKGDVIVLREHPPTTLDSTE